MILDCLQIERSSNCIVFTTFSKCKLWTRIICEHAFCVFSFSWLCWRQIRSWTHTVRLATRHGLSPRQGSFAEKLKTTIKRGKIQIIWFDHAHIVWKFVMQSSFLNYVSLQPVQERHSFERHSRVHSQNLSKAWAPLILKLKSEDWAPLIFGSEWS